MDELEAKKLAGQDFWGTLYAEPEFFRRMQPMADAYELFNAVKHLDPIVLTGCPRGYWAIKQKMEWRDEFFDGTPMICVESKNKSHFCRPGDLIIDDWPQYRSSWEGRGGTWVHHDDAKSSISKLKELGWL